MTDGVRYICAKVAVFHKSLEERRERLKMRDVVTKFGIVTVSKQCTQVQQHSAQDIKCDLPLRSPGYACKEIKVTHNEKRKQRVHLMYSQLRGD